MSKNNPQEALKLDVTLLGNILGQTISEQVGPEVLTKVEKIRQLSKKINFGDIKSISGFIEVLKNLNNDEIIHVVRAFSHFLNLANIADNNHRLRRARWHQLNQTGGPQIGSIEWALLKFKQENIVSDKLISAINNLKIDLVLTAHPTEVTRRTLMQKYDHISDSLYKLDLFDITNAEKKSLNQSLKREITEIWQTDEIRRNKPTPIDEAKWGFAVIEGSLWSAVPNYLRTLDEQLQEIYNIKLPLEANPIKFCSWMGGDRDGNPNVTPEITHRVCYMARWMAADLYEKDISKLIAELSMKNCDDVLRKIAGDANEPYRVVLRELRKLLSNTKLYTANILENINPENIILENNNLNILTNINQLTNILNICYNSLHNTGAGCVADGPLLDLIRRVGCFGISLTKLDIRQHSAKHSNLLNEITLFLDKFSIISRQFDSG